MPSTKTLRVTLQDIVGATGGSGSTATVWAQYVSPATGLNRDIHLADGAIVVPVRREVVAGTGPEHFDFEVIPSDDADVREEDQGFAVKVSWHVVAPEGGTTDGSRTVIVPSTADDPVQLGSLYTPTAIPAVTAQRIISGGTAADPLYDIRIRHDDSAGWAAEDPILSLGEEGIDVDTGVRKVGDGVTAWSALPVSVDPDALTDARTPTAHAASHVAAGSDPLTLAESQVTGLVADLAAKAQKAANLSDLASASTARTNLGLGTAATTAATAYATAAQGSKADTAVQAIGTPTPTSLTGLIVGNGTTVAAGRTLTGTADEITVTNGSGVSGNPTISLALTAAKVGALPIPDPDSFYPTDTLTAALQLIGGRHIYGTGSPEGVVTAAVGTYYTDTAGTNGAMRWAKKTGTGNTGWVCIEGDTGWRSLDYAAMGSPTGLTSGSSARIRRVGDVVHSRIALVTSASWTGANDVNNRFSWPTGFASAAGAFDSYLSGGRNSTSGAIVTFVVDQNGIRPWQNIAASQSSGVFSLTFSTDAAWPTTLPGTAS